MAIPRFQDMSCHGGARQLDASIPRLRHEASDLVATVVPRIPWIALLPRSRDKVFVQGEDRGQDARAQTLLPNYHPASPDIPEFADIEGRFYIDIATRINNVWKAQRKLTAIVWDQDYQPVEGTRVEFRRTSGSTHFKFLAPDNTEVDELVGDNAPLTDARGLAEVTVRHPPREVPTADAEVKITISIGTDEDFIILRLVRNTESPALNDVARRTSATADRLFVYQPDATNRSPATPLPEGDDPEGVVQLQEILNEVVSRNRRVPANQWNYIPLNGQYADETRAAVKLYLQHFAPINTPANWPYNLSTIGLDAALVEYLKTEYLFDPTLDAHKGWIVDKRILVGPPRDATKPTGNAWDLAPASIDGLWELYEGVVRRLQAEMVRLAEMYVTEPTFWLHRPVHQPYVQSAQRVWRIRQNGVAVLTQSNATSDPLRSPPGNAPDGTPLGQPVVLMDGELYPLVGNGAAVNGFRPIVHPAGNGWVPNASGAEFRDDQATPQNHGFDQAIEGRVGGMAYSFGCKCRPDEYRNDLFGNPHATIADNPPRRRIADWAEYEAEHKPGLRGVGNPIAPEETTANWTGCDCSGFTQNCITEALFPGGGVRVVPNSLMRRLTRSSQAGNGRVHANAIGSGGFVGNAAYARPVPLPQSNNAYDHSRHWIRRGDLIAGGGHIVWIEPEVPVFRRNGAAISMNEQEFLTYNERGDVGDFDANFQPRPFAQRRFTRKAILQPFRWWGPAINQRDIGKPYIWH
ncbi:MAG: hypothetical protein SFY69_08450 [Planctomycetota bacterium]|nr:hypothetical protein [Planctomycetota bacterium]